MSSTTTHEVHLAIYDLSMGMARGLSAQFLGPQHAVEIIPHTAILAYGKEYFFGQGIEWCNPHEFRAARGIHPIEIQSLGRTDCTERQFEDWCRAQAANGSFGTTSYDFFHRNCNNFSEEAARRGLRLPRGVPSWILELPQKFLNSPMGMVVRPMLEQMQITNTAPTNMSSGGGSARMAQPTSFASSAAPSAPVAAAANPWANIPSATNTPAAQPPTPANQTSQGTPLLDKQTPLLSTVTSVVETLISRLKPEQDQSELLSKLADAKASWTQQEINSIHQYLRSIIGNDNGQTGIALTLLRLIVLRHPSDADASYSNEEQSQSTQYLANLLLEDKLETLGTRSMGWCVLSNAVGSTHPPDWNDSTGTTKYCELSRVIDRALIDCDIPNDGASSQSCISLRQSAAAFLYNVTIDIGKSSDDMDDKSGNAELSEGVMSILLGCLEHLPVETDGVTMKRLYMAIGQLLKSPKFGKTAVGMVKDLGLFDEEIGKGKDKEVDMLAKEVSSLLQ